MVNPIPADAWVGVMVGFGVSQYFAQSFADTVSTVQRTVSTKHRYVDWTRTLNRYGLGSKASKLYLTNIPDL